jgi:hypothetical protein
LLVLAALLEVLADELLVPLEDEPADEFEETEDVGEVEADFGKKVLFPTAKPMAAASLPLPPTKIALVSSLLVITSWPLALSDAVTFALVGRSTLMVPMRSAIVSVPVDV